jgi:hypothetical protein
MLKQGFSSISNNKPRESAGWDYWFCVGTCCASILWMVQCVDNDTWRIRESAQGPAWKIVAEKPLCPRCGGYLQRAVRSLSFMTHH